MLFNKIEQIAKALNDGGIEEINKFSIGFIEIHVLCQFYQHLCHAAQSAYLFFIKHQVERCQIWRRNIHEPHLGFHLLHVCHRERIAKREIKPYTILDSRTDGRSIDCHLKHHRTLMTRTIKRSSRQ